MRMLSFSRRRWPERRRRRRCKRPRLLVTTRSLYQRARSGGAPQRQPSRLSSTTVHLIPNYPRTTHGGTACLLTRVVWVARSRVAGTSTAKAQMILARGFKPSLSGCLGAGVYV